MKLQGGFAAAVVLAIVPAIAADPSNVPQIHESPATRDARAQWFREAKFGMFIHWGLYSALAGSHEGREIDNNGEWTMDRATIPVARYAAYAKDFAVAVPQVREPCSNYGPLAEIWWDMPRNMTPEFAARAFDGSAGRAWEAGKGDRQGWLEVDLGAATPVAATAFDEPHRGAGRRGQKFRLEMKADDGWREIAAGETRGYGATQVFPAVTGQVFRMEIRESKDTAAVAEWQLYRPE